MSLPEKLGTDLIEKVGEMEIGRNPNIAPGTVAATEDGNINQGAQTELPEFQTVTQAARSDSLQLTFREVPLTTAEPTTNDQENEIREEPDETRLERRDREIRREIELDRDTSALIFRSIDTSTGDVIQQFPEEARLNLRAYLVEKEASLNEEDDVSSSTEINAE